MKEQWVMGDGLSNVGDGFPKIPNEFVFEAGGAKKQALKLVSNCDAEMTRNYELNHKEIGKNIFPFLYSEFTPDGGRYILLVNMSKTLSSKPTPEIYEISKSIAHIPLGIWAIIIRYAKDAKVGEWKSELKNYSETISKALHNLPKLELESDIQNDMTKIIGVMNGFIEQSLKNGEFTLDAFREASYSVNEQIVKLQNIAAETQVYAFTKLLTEWKSEVGEENWRNLHAVISAQWTLSTDNVHQLIISNMMSSPDLAAQNIFVTSMPLSGIDEARALCGRILGDRIMAKDILSQETERGRENIYSLSTSRDLISVAAMEVIEKMKSKCPHLEK